MQKLKVYFSFEVNENQKLKPVKKASKYYKDFKGLNVAVLGLTFKPGTDDLREAPSLVTVPILIDDGANVKAWDPVGCENFKKRVPEGITYCDTIEETLRGADLCFIFTEWPEVKALDPHIFEKEMKHAIVIDGRNCFSIKEIKDVKMVYESIGRSTVDNRS